MAESELAGKGVKRAWGMAEGGPQCLQSLRLAPQANRWADLI